MPSFSADFGNAILSRFPFTHQRKRKLKSARDLCCEDRAMIDVELNVNPNRSAPPKPLRIVLTHVDHTCERARELQLGEAISHIDSEKTHILMGDFNSLKRSDYTEEVWKELTKIRKENKWELPVSEVTDALEQNYRYTDAFASSFENEKIDYLFGTPSHRETHATKDNTWVDKVHKLATW